MQNINLMLYFPGRSLLFKLLSYAGKEFRQTHLFATLIVGLFITHELTRHARYKYQIQLAGTMTSKYNYT